MFVGRLLGWMLRLEEAVLTTKPLDEPRRMGFGTSSTFIDFDMQH
jgi:hypothetical protein